MTTFISIHNLNQFHSIDYSNFNHLLPMPESDFFYIVSNANELLQLRMSNLELVNKHSMKRPCSPASCEKIKIEVVQISKYIWFCFSYLYQTNSTKLESPMCYVLNEDKLDNERIAQWYGDIFISNDFEHRSIQSIFSNYIYSGFYWNKGKELTVFKIPIDFLHNNKLAELHLKAKSLPRSFIKAPGDFITSFQHNDSIYFLYMETDFLCGYKENKLITRLLRLCENDNDITSREFSVFNKVNVECELINSNKAIPPYKYRVATNGHWLPLSQQLVVTFTSNYEENESSAICVYSIQIIEDAFNSDFKKSREEPEYKSNERKNICQQFSINELDVNLLNNLRTLSKTYPLHKSIVTNKAIYSETNTRFIEIASEESYWSNHRRIILFISSKTNNETSYLEISLKPKFCILRKFLSMESITMLKTISENNKTLLFIGTSQRLIKIPMNTCYAYGSENQCLSPYCYWDSNTKKCTYISKEKEFLLISSSKLFCPSASMQTQQIISKSRNSCRLKSTTNDLLSIGVCDCNQERNTYSNEIKFSISTECKVDGNWTIYSLWSDCSVTCGKGTQMRSRTCDNPRPQNGGKECVGDNVQYQKCMNKNCDDISSDKSKIIYSEWSYWSACSKSCGFSIQKRIRNCVFGKCEPSQTETKLCNKSACEYIIYSEWSPWSKFNITSSTKTRFRFQCLKKYQYELSTTYFNSVSRHQKLSTCYSEECHQKNRNSISNGKLVEWSEWSSCSNSCDSTEWTIRTRNCTSTTCFGSTIDYKLCPTKLCNSMWSCWSTWTGCLSVCETKSTRMRSRKCIYDNNKTSCKGHKNETSNCPLTPCFNAYSKWSEWSPCNSKDFRTRTRRCLHENQCSFPLIQKTLCTFQLIKDKSAEYSLIYMVVSGLVGFVLGILVGSILCYIWWRCTIHVITTSYAESTKISNSGNPPEVYDSLQTITDGFDSLYRQRSLSNSETYYKAPSPRQFFEQSSSHFPFQQSFPLMYSHVQEEHMEMT